MTVTLGMPVEQRVAHLERKLNELINILNRHNAAAEKLKADYQKAAEEEVERTKEKFYGAWRLIRKIALETSFSQKDLDELENVIFSDELSAEEIAERAKDITESMA